MSYIGHTYYLPIQQVDTLVNATAAGAETQAPADSAAVANYLYIPPHFTIEHETQEHSVIAGKSLNDLINEIKNVKPNPNKNVLEPIANAWPESVKTTASVESFEKTAIPKQIDTYTNLGLLLVMLTFFIIGCERIGEGAFRVLTHSFNLKRIKEMEGQSALETSRNIMAIFGVLLVAFIIANQNVTYNFMGDIPVIAAFGIIVVSVVIYSLIKSWILWILDYVNGSSAFRLINKFWRTYLALAILMLLAGDMVFALIPNLPVNVIIGWLILCCAVPSLLYLNMERRVMFQSRFSVFTYILYLCTLEILPIVLIVKTI
jgi:hypothetical protein